MPVALSPTAYFGAYELTENLAAREFLEMAHHDMPMLRRNGSDHQLRTLFFVFARLLNDCWDSASTMTTASVKSMRDPYLPQTLTAIVCKRPSGPNNLSA